MSKSPDKPKQEEYPKTISPKLIELLKERWRLRRLLAEAWEGEKQTHPGNTKLSGD